MTWLGQSRDVMGLDTESGGLSPTQNRLRMVQFGDTGAGWAIPWERWGGVAMEALAKYEGRLCGHNVIPYDSRVFRHNADGWELPVERTDDAMLQAAVLDSAQRKGLKPLCDRFVDPDASAGQKILHEGMDKNGWTWDTVPTDYGPYWMYSALDPVLNAYLDVQFTPEIAASGGQEAYDLERATGRICSQMMSAGMLVDTGYMEAESAKLQDYTRSALGWLKDNHGVESVNSAVQLQRAMTALGTPLTDTTATGLPKTDKDTLGAFRHYPDQRVATLIQQVLAVRHAQRITDFYFGSFREHMESGDVIRASINILAARTSRMCLPESHRLLTARGVLHVDDVRVGDKTLGMDGTWTTVRAVHRYTDAETVIYEHKSARLEATPEHRWVTSLERRPDERRVEPLGQARRNVHLVPSTDAVFDFTAREVPLDGTETVQFAALVGWLVSDGRAHDNGPGAGLRAMVYQTEDKFYAECLRCIPDAALMYDRVTRSGTRHHEMGLRARWLRPRLEAAGLHADPLLRTSETLVPWVLSLSMLELRAFFTAVWLADGSTAHPQNKHISCASAPLRIALQYAGYRLGLRSRITVDKPGGWSNGERYGLHFNTRRVTSRQFTRTPGRANVWCVTTDDGTCTAWDEAPYLTGNSVSEPPLQQLPRDDKMVRGAFVPHEGCVFISCDLAQIEARLAAHFSQDQALIEVFRLADETGADFFCALAGQIFQEPIAKGDRRRSLTKNVTYGKLYAAGLDKMAATAGVPVEQMRPVRDGFNATYHELLRFSTALVHETQQMDRPFVTTPTGRRLMLPKGREATTAFNTLLQGHAAEYMKMCLSRCASSGLGSYLRMVVHDEAILEVPREDAKDALRVLEECMTDRTSYRVPITADGVVMPERWVKG